MAGDLLGHPTVDARRIFVMALCRNMCGRARNPARVARRENSS
ncbi:hypothetical protein [Nonomuraea sp. NPDC049709]